MSLKSIILAAKATQKERKHVKQKVSSLTEQGKWYWAKGKLDELLVGNKITAATYTHLLEQVDKGLTSSMFLRYIVGVKTPLDELEFIHGYNIDMLLEEVVRVAIPEGGPLNVVSVKKSSGTKWDPIKVSGSIYPNELKEALLEVHMSSVREELELHKKVKCLPLIESFNEWKGQIK